MGVELILLHGFTQTGASWGPVLEELAGRYKALAPDLPGHGAFSARPASFPAMDGYVRALARGSFVLCGYSLGGRVALHAALTVRPERLVLVSASPGIRDPAEREARRAADEALARRIERDGLEAFVAEWSRLPLWEGMPRGLADLANADRRRNDPAGLASALRGLGTGVMPSLWDRLPELGMPVELVVGERDAKFAAIAREMADRLPDARVHVAANAGHAVHLEAPGVIARAISG